MSPKRLRSTHVSNQSIKRSVSFASGGVPVDTCSVSVSKTYLWLERTDETKSEADCVAASNSTLPALHLARNDEICKQRRQIQAARSQKHKLLPWVSNEPFLPPPPCHSSEKTSNDMFSSTLYADSFLWPPRPSADLPRSSKLGFSCAPSPLLGERSFFTFCSPVPSVTMLPSPPRPQW